MPITTTGDISYRTAGYMSGNNIEWTDAQGAKLALELYNEGCARARAKMIRRKHGDSLFVGDL